MNVRARECDAVQHVIVDNGVGQHVDMHKVLNAHTQMIGGVVLARFIGGKMK